MLKRLVSLSIGISVSFAGIASDKISYLKHQETVNNTLCKTLITCREGATQEKCVTQMNQISKANPNNAKIEVYQSSSQNCLSSLKALNCENALTKSVSGPCTLSALQKESSPIEQTATVVEKPKTADVFNVGDSAKVEFNNEWYPAKVIQAKEANNKKFYQIKFTQSGIEAWVAPNRIMAENDNPSTTVGNTPYSEQDFNKGREVQAEYDGKWYPATLLEKKKYLHSMTYKIKYKTNGVVEWVAANRIKKSDS